MRLLMGLFGLALAWSCGAHAQTPAAMQTGDGARVFLVLDASGSMWGRVGNQTKIEVARETIRAILKDWRPQDELGLVAYGHRRKGDCGDIEILKPVGKVDAAALMTQVSGISPKGMTPMSDAVKMAAAQLKTVEGVTSVILVSDGVETCRADPCAVAAELKKADIKLVVHTVGFDIQDRQAQRQLECMAQATGGLSLSAKGPGELLKSIGQAVEAARKKAPPAAPLPPPQPKAEPRPAWNLEGSARLAEGDDPLVGKDSITWVFHKPAPAGVDPEYVDTTYKNRIEMQLPAGEYLVEAIAGVAKLKTRVTIDPAKMNKLDVVMNAGRLGLRARRTETENQKGDVFWEVVDKGGETVFNSYDAETSTIIAVGKYTVSMSLGAAKQTREVEITAGDTATVDIVAGVGRLQGSVVFAKGGPAVRDPFVEVFAGAEAVENESSVANTYDNKPKFDLASGAYRLRIKTDAVDRTFPLEIKAGDRLEMELALDAGIAFFEAPGAEAIEIKGSGKDIYAERRDIATLYPAFPNYALPTGTYVVVAIKGDQKKEAEFEIKPGQRTVTKVTLP